MSARSRLTVSNIAWPLEADAEAYRLLASLGIEALEAAPPRLWPNWDGISSSSAATKRDQFAAVNLQLSSLQAILFGRPECRLFGTEQEQALLKDHLVLCAEIAAALGASKLVFGAPKNRDRGDLSKPEALARAAAIFRAVAPHYERQGVCLCLEANPEQYGCNFITNSFEAAELVRAVDSPGFRLHLDTACMALAGEDPATSIRAHRELVTHFHVSEPNLGAFESPTINHDAAAAALSEIGYTGWISLEMRQTEQPLTSVETAVRYLRSTYGFGL